MHEREARNQILLVKDGYCRMKASRVLGDDGKIVPATSPWRMMDFELLLCAIALHGTDAALNLEHLRLGGLSAEVSRFYRFD